VCAYADQISVALTECFDVLSKSLGRVYVEDCLGFSQAVTDFSDGLFHPSFIVDLHQGNKQRPVGNLRKYFVCSHDARFIGANSGDGKSGSLKTFYWLQNGFMFHCGCNDVHSPGRPSELFKAYDSKVIALGCAARENDSAVSQVSDTRNLVSRKLYRFRGTSSE